ncbi:type I restriction endonuclease subunit R [Candidatus Magnetominusculus xianensis]|uniref:Type I restriction enzyme endonuclease subunit n=1 Tax=Candidatus Magnetominusculus xianensis TaxID=1748249 RepID=A0ABR5SHR4_9BACT|nr:DEAD/DEAH box helicase [Candidatus Magnetominusculus xianensis]MBF0404849.1 type I restriction endonuclease subunit R [Nitrospirota bacterium]
MTHTKFIESDLEQATLEWLEELGYSIAFGPDFAPDGKATERKSYRDVVLADRLRSTISLINPNIPSDAKEEAIKKVVNVAYSSPNLLITNQAFHKMLVEGVDVEYRRKDGTIAGDKVYLFDSRKLDNNDWLAVNQYTVIENNHNRRPDIVIFLNGLPIAVFELKNPADANATIKGAFNQIQTYKSEIPSLFTFNEICVLIDHIKNALAGTISSDTDRFVGWKSVDGKKIAKANDLKTLIEGIFTKEKLLDIIRYFIVFESEKDSNINKIIKKLAAYHQYFAVNNAVEKTRTAASLKGDRRAGVVWHTQGSGKSLSMVFYAGKIIQVLDNPTVVLLTDRNDLDGQLFGVFSNCSDIIRQIPKQAQDRADLKKLLSVASGGVIFTTIQKFLPENKGDKYPMLSDRRNIVVIADEAHRSQYDFIDGFARHMHDALPKATFIGFTGTPIELTDKNTRAVFGEYIDVYDIMRAVEDKATVPIYYEARLAKIELLKEVTPKIDAEFEELTEGEEIEKKEKLKSKWARLEAMIGSDKRIALIAKDVVEHFEARLSVMDGKGMFVSMSRRIAVELYDEIIKLRPQWHNDDIRKGFLKVVMTGAASDPANYQRHIHTKEERDLLADRIKNPKDELKLVIVRDMWLTGFDVPSLHTMYIDKPMRGHGLMQAIARVNRVYKDKPGGLIVDYLGIAPSLKEALAYYTQEGKETPTVKQEEAVNIMLEKYELVRAMYHGFDYSGFFTDKTKDKAEIAGKAMDHILESENGKKRYLQSVSELSQAFALSVPSEEALRIRDDVAFFQTVRAFITKFEQTGGLGGPTMEDYDQAIKQIVSNAVTSDKVINIFDAAGLRNPNIAVLSDEFLQEVQGLERKNVALEVLKRLLNDEIRTMEKKFLVKSRSFSKMLEETIRKYQNQTIETAQVIAELVELARKIREEKNRGANLNLTDDELAFYDALSANDSAVMELGDETLKKIAKELVAMLRKNTAIDWTLKEQVRAKLRVYVKKLLNKYKYPPDKQESATKTVIEQAEVLCKDWTGE